MPPTGFLVPNGRGGWRNIGTNTGGDVTPPDETPPEGVSYLVNVNFANWDMAAFNAMTANQKGNYWDDRFPAGGGNWLATYTIGNDAGTQYMRNPLPANKVHSDPAPSGISNKINTGFRVQSATVEMKLRFFYEDGMDDFWGYGGKLPGAGGALDGYSPPTGGAVSDTGWTGRQMWLGKGMDGSWPYSAVRYRKNLGVYYAYDYGLTGGGTYGTNRYWSPKVNPTSQTESSFESNEWTRIKIDYQMNDAGVANGIHRVTQDGVVVQLNEAWAPRSTANPGITHFLYDIFRGGNTASWRVPVETYVDLAWVYMYTTEDI